MQPTDTDKQVQYKIVDSVEKLYNEVNEIPFDLDKGLTLLYSFLKSTHFQSKQFKKLVKKAKFNGTDPKQAKKVLAFVEKALYPKFETEFLKEFYSFEEYKVLNKDVMSQYIAGIFISGNADARQKINVPEYLKLIIVEMTNRMYTIILEEDKKSI